MNDVVQKTITLNCHAIESGVTEVRFSAVLRLRIFPDHFEILQEEASPDDEPSQVTRVYKSDGPYTLGRAIAAIRDYCEPLGRDFRPVTSIDGEHGYRGELLKMAWMGNQWELEDAEAAGDDPPVRHPARDVAWLVTRLPDSDGERAYNEIMASPDWDSRLGEILNLLDGGAGSIDLDSASELFSEEFSASDDVLTQLLKRVRHWATERKHAADVSALRWRHFLVHTSGRLRATFSTNGVDCRWGLVGPGGQSVEEDTEKAIERVLLYLDESLLTALRNEGFADLAEKLRARAET